MTDAKRYWIMGIVAGTILLAGTVFGVDWMNYFYNTDSVYPFYGKPAITFLSFVLVLIIGKDFIDRKDRLLLVFAFMCMLPTDILMSVVPLNPEMTVGGTVFLIGGILSIVAHIFIIIRVGRGWHWMKDFKLTDLWLPVLVFGSAVIFIAILWTDIVRVGHAVLGPVYTAFFCTTMWLSWETVRRGTYPRANAWMAALAATGWYATEVIGEIYNLGLRDISEIAFRIVWIFYGSNVVLWALSGFNWGEKNSS